MSFLFFNLKYSKTVISELLSAELLKMRENFTAYLLLIVCILLYHVQSEVLEML